MVRTSVVPWRRAQSFLESLDSNHMEEGNIESSLGYFREFRESNKETDELATMYGFPCYSTSPPLHTFLEYLGELFDHLESFTISLLAPIGCERSYKWMQCRIPRKK